jgi:predicted  nucleic acid-binding Zn-ribbon protein
MIEETIRKIESRIRSAESLPGKKKSDLLDLLATLKEEITSLPETHAEHAESIAGFMDRSTHEATRLKKNPELLRLSIAGLEESVKGFEASHPRLVSQVGAVCTMLANAGL